MMRFIRISMALAAVLAAPLALAADAGLKQPVFLICPHKEKMSAWSVYLTVDRGDPSKVLSLGLEKLKKQNSKDSSYEAVLASQKDAKTEREELGTLAAKDFASGMLEVEKDNALDLQVTPQADGSLKLMVSLRISADLRFTIGGKESAKRSVNLKYDKAKKQWGAQVEKIQDAEGNKIDAAASKAISGIAFPVAGTGIYRVVGVIEGLEPVLLMER